MIASEQITGKLWNLCGRDHNETEQVLVVSVFQSKGKRGEGGEESGRGTLWGPGKNINFCTHNLSCLCLILFKQPVVRLIEEASCRGLKEVRFVTWHNQYILNIKDGFQQNACFRREIKRRPLLRSCVVLMPFLQYVPQQNWNCVCSVCWCVHRNCIH